MRQVGIIVCIQWFGDGNSDVMLMNTAFRS